MKKTNDAMTNLLYGIGGILLIAIIIAMLILLIFLSIMPDPLADESEEYDTKHYNEEDYRL